MGSQKVGKKVVGLNKFSTVLTSLKKGGREDIFGNQGLFLTLKKVQILTKEKKN